MSARNLPLYPYTDVTDERTTDVLLLDHGDEFKTTAEPLVNARGWRIVDWEVMDFDGEPHWFARSWHSIPSSHIAAIAKATGESP